MGNQFGEKIKQLREANSLLQRQVAIRVSIDTPMLSKIERGERRAKKEQIKIFAELLGVSDGELMTLWLADQLIKVVENEAYALQAMHIAEREVKMITKAI
jgi:transcriptional regulator with XRE-family HTH domain